MIKYKWWRWLLVVLFGHRSFILEGDGINTHVLLKGDLTERTTVVMQELMDRGYIEEWGPERDRRRSSDHTDD